MQKDTQLEWASEFADEFFNEIISNKTNTSPKNQLESNNNSQHSINSEILKPNESVSHKIENSRYCLSDLNLTINTNDNDHLKNNDLYQIPDKSNGIPKIGSLRSLDNKDFNEIDDLFNNFNIESNNPKSQNSSSKLSLENYFQNNENYNITGFLLNKNKNNQYFDSNSNSSLDFNELSNNNFDILFKPPQNNFVSQNTQDSKNELIDFDNSRFLDDDNHNYSTNQITSILPKKESKLNTISFSNSIDDEFNQVFLFNKDNLFKPKPKPRHKKLDKTNIFKDDLIITDESPRIIFSNKPVDSIFNSNNNSYNNDDNNNNNINNNKNKESQIELLNKIFLLDGFKTDSFSDKVDNKVDLIKTNEIDSFWEEICTEKNNDNTNDNNNNNIENTDSLSNPVKPQPKKRQRFLFKKDISTEKLYSSLNVNLSNSRQKKRSFNNSGFSKEVLNNGDLFWNTIFNQYDDQNLDKMFVDNSIFNDKNKKDNNNEFLTKTITTPPRPPIPPKPKILPPLPPRKPIFTKTIRPPIPTPRKTLFHSHNDLSLTDDKDSCAYDSEPDISAFDLTPKHSKNKKFFNKIKNYFKQNVIIKQNKNL